MIRRDLLNGRFRLVANIGRGGQGTVWLAQDELLGREVALKQLADGERASREACALARVRHPNVVTIHDLLTVRDERWLVMAFVLGKPLSQILRAGPLGEREVAAVALPVVRGLMAAHRADVVHRDVKPDNILVADGGGVMLVDFGTAQVAGLPSITDAHTIVCTADYAAPERFGYGGPVGPAADVWSLGVTMFRAIEGYSPFRRDGEYSDSATVDAVLRAPLPPPRAADELAGLVTRMLLKEAKRRPGLDEVERQLRRVLDGAAPVRVPLSRPAVSEQDLTTAAFPADAAIPAASVMLDDLAGGVAVAWLLSQPREPAAAALKRAGSARKRHLLAELAEVRPDAVADFLGIWTEAEAGDALGLLSAPLITRVLNAVLLASPVGDAADIARALRCARRPAVLAAALCGLPPDSVVSTLGMLDSEQAVAIYQSVIPEAAAGLYELDRTAIGPLLEKANPAFRAQVLRFVNL